MVVDMKYMWRIAHTKLLYELPRFQTRITTLRLFLGTFILESLHSKGLRSHLLTVLIFIIF